MAGKPQAAQQYLDGAGKAAAGGASGDPSAAGFLPPAAVAFPPYGQVVILGKLQDA